MNDHELDVLIARAAPVTDAEVEGWVTDPAPKDLAERIMATADFKAHGVRGPRRWRGVMELAAIVVAVAGLGVAVNLQESDSGVVTVGDNGLITSEMILEDGLVTEVEYRAAVRAVVSCLAEAGIEAKADFADSDGLDGHASITSQGSSGLTSEQSRQEWDRCMEEHLSGNVGLGWASALGQIDLDESRRKTITTFECVEQQTGIEFGELTYDRFDYLTTEGQQTKNTASEHQDHRPWVRCQNQLGYLAESHAETEALVDCVETSTGIDFGQVTYDESGFLTEAGQQTVRAASSHQSDKPWNACRDELGLE